MTDVPGEVELATVLEGMRADMREARIHLARARQLAEDYGFTGWKDQLDTAHDLILGIAASVVRHGEDHLSPSVRR